VQLVAQDFGEQHGLVVELIAGGVHESDRPAGRTLAELAYPVTTARELAPVPRPELVELCRVVRGPAPALSARRQVATPLVAPAAVA